MLRGKITYRLLASLIAALSVCTTLSAQSTRVRGRVTDAASGAPMQFVSVVFPGTTTGITTDEEGIYTLETRDTVGRVQASMVGYATQTKPLTRGGFNQVDFALEAVEFGIGSVVITHYRSQPAAEMFQKRLETLGVRVYRHYIIPDYPSNVELIVSENGFGKNDYIETERSLVVVTAPGPGSGKMATCLSQLYHEHRRGVNAGYAKFETFPIWNVPLKHPINLAYEAATADLDDINMIDPFHLEA